MRGPQAARSEPSSAARLDVERAPHGGVRIALGGSLDVDRAGPIWERAVAAARAASPGSVVRVDAAAVDAFDGAGAALLVTLETEGRAAGARVETEGLASDFAELVALLRPSAQDAPRPPADDASALERLGRGAAGLATDLGDFVAFVGELTVMSVATLRHPSQFRFREAVQVADRAGIGAIPIVALVGFLLGLILAFQGAIPMQRFGAQIFVADMLGIAMIRELGALMTAILLTARSASAFAAEIGTMKVNEEIDAITTMGLEPVRFLVLPRVAAAVAVVPALTLLTILASLLGGLVVFLQLGYPAVTFWNRVLEFVTVTDFLTGLFKAVVFGLIVAAVGCLRGLETGAGAQAVGRSTTSAVVSGIILIAVADGVFAVVFYVLGI